MAIDFLSWFRKKRDLSLLDVKGEFLELKNLREHQFGADFPPDSRVHELGRLLGKGLASPPVR